MSERRARSGNGAPASSNIRPAGVWSGEARPRVAWLVAWSAAFAQDRVQLARLQLPADAQHEHEDDDRDQHDRDAEDPQKALIREARLDEDAVGRAGEERDRDDAEHGRSDGGAHR